MFYNNETIAAISTALGTGGIGIIRISGKEAFTILDKVFKTASNKDMSKVNSHTIHFGHIYDETNNIIDEVLVSVMKAPNTYTKEDIVEINCHGGIIPIQKTLEEVLKNGARLAEPGEFTKRAFLNGRLDLSQAEAVIDVINSKTNLSLQSAVSQLEGALSSEIKNLKQQIISMLAHIEVSIDYPEYDTEELTYTEIENGIEDILNKISQLIATADTGKILKEGLSTAIIGKPNVGKSSLLNALIKEQKAIVTDIPGTTRDIIEENINIHGVPLKIIDTAGIRETEDIVEKIGVSRSKKSIEKADLVLFILDISRQLSQEDKDIMEMIKSKKVIVLVNKIDMPHAFEKELVKNYISDCTIISISVQENLGINILEKTIKEMFFKGEITVNNNVLITNARHKEALIRAKQSLVSAKNTITLKLPEDCISIDLKNTFEALGEITGETVHEELVKEIFSKFCLGK